MSDPTPTPSPSLAQNERGKLEAELVQRTGNWLAQAGKDATTIDGTNADLNGPIAYAVRRLGYPVADRSNVTDEDLAQVPVTRIDELLDVAELRTLKNILGNLDQVNYRMGPISKNMSDLRTSVEKRIEALELDINATYGTLMPDATLDNAPWYAPTGEDWLGVL